MGLPDHQEQRSSAIGDEEKDEDTAFAWCLG